ncbi:invasion protein CiaB [Candidatus Gracilibacteria bacterium]|nr:invasion protein CiaB [Candidatus Gracilibacteria bacterium]
MNKQQFEKNIAQIHKLFEANESHFNTLSSGIHKDNEARIILDDFLDHMGLEKNATTRYIASARISDKKCESLDVYLKKNGYSQTQRDAAFDSSYRYVQAYYEKLQDAFLSDITSAGLLSDFYGEIFTTVHKLGKLYSELFLEWNRKLMFEQNRELEARFDDNQEAIIFFLEENNLFDTGHHGELADRCYSVLQKDGETYKSVSYALAFPDIIQKISLSYDQCIAKLETLEDEIYDRKSAYIRYFKATQKALTETNPNNCVKLWSEVDIAWMAIDTPIQPGHLMEYYDDAYRRSVAIEFDLRLSDPSLMESTVAKDVEHMYEAMFDEIGRENFKESYEYSLKNQKQVQLYIGAPVLQYASFLTGAYSAQVVPNDGEVSKVFGKKIFAFPKYILEAQKSAPKMKLDYEMIDREIIKKHTAILEGDENRYYEIYDIETIGHEYGHTLWLTPSSEVTMGEKGLFKNIEEFKATAGGMVAYFIKGGNAELDEDVLVTYLYRSIKMMRYREVEDILPYYCECLIHLHVLFESGILTYRFGKISFHFTSELLQIFKDLLTGTYTQLMFTYLNQMEAGNFLFEFVVKENGVFLPKDAKCRKFVEDYYSKYQEIGNEVMEK